MRYLQSAFLSICVITSITLVTMYASTPANAQNKPRLSNVIGEAIQKDNFYPRVKLITSMGDIVIELRRDRAPATVNNFLMYVKEQAYNGTLFHRVIADYIVQGGGYDKDMKELDAKYSIVNESGNGLKNNHYTVAMARMLNPHSAKRQFFFNMKDNDNLNPGRQWGYTVFGEVVEGQDIVDAMSLVSTHIDPQTGLPDTPVEDIVLQRISILPEPSFE
ncbi:MAG: peptidylprolyl isomerase [Glaciecola sp.]